MREENVWLRQQLEHEQALRIRAQRQLREQRDRNVALEQEVSNAAAAAQELGEHILQYFAASSAPPSPALDVRHALNSSNESETLRDLSAMMVHPQAPAEQLYDVPLHPHQYHTPKKGHMVSPEMMQPPATYDHYMSPGRGALRGNKKMQAVRISQRLTTMAADLRGKLDTQHAGADDAMEA